MSQQFTRRRFLLSSSVVLTSATLTACGGQAPQTPNSAATTGEPAAVSLVNALGVQLPADALPLDQQFRLEPISETGGGFGHIMESLYNRAFEHAGGYETLTTLDNDLKVIGIGAESWSVADDGLTWDFKLRKELVFSDGKPVTANDWVYTLQRSLSNGYDFGWFYSDIKNASKVLSKELPVEQLGISAPDDYTLRIVTEAPTPYLPAIGVWFGVAAKHAYEQNGENWALDPAKYVASGPFTLKEFERGVKHRWELNTTYKGIRRPYFTQIREEKLPSSLPAYIAGDLRAYEINGNSPANEAQMVESNPALKAEAHRQPSSNTDYLGFNTLAGKFPPLDNPDVRMALSKAIDKEKLIGEIFRGFADPAWGILPKGFPNYIGDRLKALEPNKYDPEAARQLLSKAGYADGKGFPSFDMWVRQPTPAQLALAQALQARWKENLGITIEIRPADFQSFTDTAFVQKNAPLYYVAYSLDYYDPATFLNVFRNGGRHPHENEAWTTAYNTANATLAPDELFKLMAQSEEDLVTSTAWYFLQSPVTQMLWPCNLAGEAIQPNKDGFQFHLGGGVGCPHAYEGMYWSNSTCRADLKV